MNRATRVADRTEAGFTLIESLVAIIVLSFGIIAITNLMTVAASSNAVANQSTAAATIATREMERLKALPFVDACLDEGGDLDDNVPDVAVPPALTAADGTCVAGVYWTLASVNGVGRILVRWSVDDVVPSRGADPDLPAGLKFITVRAEGQGALTGRRSRAEFTTFRTENPDPSMVVVPAP